MTRREARRHIREHWAKFIALADAPDDPLFNDQAFAVWNDECLRIARRIVSAAAKGGRDAE